MCNKCKNRNNKTTGKILLSLGILLIGVFALLSFQSKDDTSFEANLNKDAQVQLSWNHSNLFTDSKCGGGDKKDNAKKETESSESKCGSDTEKEDKDAKKCGAGKCGGDAKKEAKDAKKCGDGKCGGDDKKEAKKATETRCGAGKCGGA